MEVDFQYIHVDDKDSNVTMTVRAEDDKAGRVDGGAENPFRSELLNHETLEMYHELLKRPLPRLPKLYTLPPR